MKKVQGSLVIVILILMSACLTAQIDPGTENLTHWWSFDDGTANDMVGEAHGTVIGNAEISGGALHIDSLNQWVELPGDLILVADYAGITVSTWFTTMADSNDGYHMIVYFGDTIGGLGANGLFISPCRGDDVSRGAISCGNESAPYNAESGANGPETDDGNLHHMALTIDDFELIFYVDGEWMGTAELSEDNALWNISPNYAYIGKGGYSDDPVLRGDIHDVRVFNRALNDGEIFYLYEDTPTSKVENSDALPNDFVLGQNYPNPFNPATTIDYSLPYAANATLSIYNMLGQKVATLADGLHQAGAFQVTWNGLDDSGRQMNSGFYIYKLESESRVETRKMLLLQ